MRLLLSARVGAGDDAPGSASKSYDVGLVKQLPAPQLSGNELEEFNASVEQCATLARSNLSEWDETSNAFLGDPFSCLRVHRSIKSLTESRVAASEEKFIQCSTLAEYIDRTVARALGFGDIETEILNEELERPLTRLSNNTDPPLEIFTAAYLTKDPLPGEILPGGLAAEADVRTLSRRKQQTYLRSHEDICRIFEVSPARFVDLRRRLALIRAVDLNSCAQDLVSFVLGTAYGRWDIRYATGEKTQIEFPNPFAPMPLCPPGQLQNANGLPARPEDVPANYPVDIAWEGILVDDLNHPLDLKHRVREVIEIILKDPYGGSSVEAIEHEACGLLGVDSLRDYFRKPASFFADHLKRYSKSRRQAPIYWQLSAGNGSYSVWLYYHRFTQDTLYRVLRDFVEPRIQQAEGEQFELESQGALSGDAATRLQESQSLLQDLRLLKSELDLVAPLWNPNLNDGVIINHAILWRITPYTTWQKKCKECWDKLVKGDYDWAHLAFHLWPERVIKKCQTDRSLAIAHGLEERLWQETNNGNWLQHQVSEAELQALIAEHTKPAVQNALERFVAAPPPVAAARTRAPGATKSTSTGTTRRPRGSATAVDAAASRQTLLVLTAALAEGLSRNAIASALDVEPISITPVIKQLKESGQIEQLGAARGARYRLTEQGRAAVESQVGEDD